MLFSHVKISSFRAKVHLVFHWCLYNKTTYLGLGRKCQFLTKIMSKLPLQKCNFFSTLLKLNFYCLESLFLYVGHNQKIYIGLLKRRTTLEENVPGRTVYKRF